MSSFDWYNQILTQVSTLTSSGLLMGIGEYSGTNRRVLSNLFEKKIIAGKNLRPLIFFIGFCIAKGRLININELTETEQITIAKITAALEAENISSYYINHYLDNKAGIKNKQDEKNRVLAGILSREIAQNLIDKSSTSQDVKAQLNSALKCINTDITKAQIFDINTAIFSNLKMFSSDEHFERLYFQRCRDISGQFYGRCAEMGYIVGQGNTEETPERKKLSSFYTEMMTLLQFANDFGDYAPPHIHSGTQEKNYYKDYASDFFNQRLTYPNYLLLTRASSPKEISQIYNLSKQGFSETNISALLYLLDKSKALQDSCVLLNKKFNEQKKNLWLQDSELRTLVSSSLIIIRSNKLISAVKTTLKNLSVNSEGTY